MNSNPSGFFLHRLLTVCFVFLILSTSFSQVFIESYPPVSNNTDMGVRISGLSNLSDRLPYERISGSPFWSEEWQLASLYGNTEKEHWLCKTKLNLATGEVYYLSKDGNELVTDDGFIKKIVFHKNDDTTIHVALFILNPKGIKLNQETRNSYLQVLNTGEYEMMKLNKRTLASADSLFGTLKRYFFTTESNYFISHGEMLNQLKKLDRDNIMSYVPGSSAYAEWAKQNKINFKREEEVVVFLNYYNSKK